MKNKTAHLKQLGGKTDYSYDHPSSKILETFSNTHQENNYQVEFVFPEFTSLCPKTGQPDFATIIIRYKPNKKCIESKSLKLYFFSYRNEGTFMETITNCILDDLVEVCDPFEMKVIGNFNARGGTVINVFAEYKNETIFS